MASWSIITAGAIAVGAALGGYAGHATVQGIRSDAVVTERAAGAYGVPVSRFNDAGTDPAAWPTGETPAAVVTARYEGDCTDCSDWELGYRWGKSRDLRGEGACNVDSWSFQQGCEAAVRARGDAT